MSSTGTGIDALARPAPSATRPKEPEGVERDLRERAREIAASVASGEVDCPHLLIAMLLRVHRLLDPASGW